MQKKLYEVGVGHLGVSYGALLWDKPEWNIVMFEPHPRYYKEMMEAKKNRQNVTIHNVAIGDYNGEVEFFEKETSSFIKDIKSPICQTEDSSEKDLNSFKVQLKKISEFDNGDIDYLRIDTEGAEWFTLKHLKSRPETINIETHGDNAQYINPFLYEIEEWMEQNNYSRVSIDHCDSVYKRNY
jgi:hypothetical protein